MRFDIDKTHLSKFGRDASCIDASGQTRTSEMRPDGCIQERRIQTDASTQTRPWMRLSIPLRTKRLCFNFWLHLGALPFVFWCKNGFFLRASFFFGSSKKKRLVVQPLYFLRNCDLKHTVIKTSKNVHHHVLSLIECHIVSHFIASCTYVQYFGQKNVCTNLCAADSSCRLQKQLLVSARIARTILAKWLNGANIPPCKICTRLPNILLAELNFGYRYAKNTTLKCGKKNKHLS